jgi:hypothetical protein
MRERGELTMSETPYVETDALLAVMRGDVDEARRLVDGEMMPGERAALLGHLRELVFLVDDRNRCEGCGEPVRPTEGISVGLGARTIWCRPCHAARPLPKTGNHARDAAYALLRQRPDDPTTT